MHLLAGALGLEAKARLRTLAVKLDLTKRFFELIDILSQRVQKEFRVLRSGDNARMDFCFRNARKHARKIDNELGGRVRDDREVRVYSLGFFIAEFYVNLLRLSGVVHRFLISF